MSVALTNIVDQMVDADGTPAQGQVTINWPMFMVNGTAVTQGQRTYDIVDGQINLNLFPTSSALPSGSYYTATFQLGNGSVFDEYWVVPSGSAPMKLNQIRAMFPPAPGLFINIAQLTGGNAVQGQILGWNGTQWVPMNAGVPPTPASAMSFEGLWQTVQQMHEQLQRLETAYAQLIAQLDPKN